MFRSERTTLDGGAKQSHYTHSVVDGFVSKYLVHSVQARNSASGRPSYEGWWLWVMIRRPRSDFA